VKWPYKGSVALALLQLASEKPQRGKDMYGSARNSKHTFSDEFSRSRHA
jgi:hypothetical protein